MSAVDWTRMAAPQAGGYDVETALGLARDEQKWKQPSRIKPPTFFEGRVGIRPWPFGPLDVSTLVPGELDHPHLGQAEEHLRRLWPDAYSAFQHLIVGVYPIHDTAHVPGDGTIGSSSGHSVQRPFTVYATYFDPFGTAEAFVHEMAHVKLRCLGVQIESATRMIQNDPSELYVSPLRSYKRPMTAVVHAYYSWLHITELDARLAEHDLDRAMTVFGRNLARVEQMREEIARHVRTDEAGDAFLAACSAWADTLTARGESLTDTF